MKRTAFDESRDQRIAAEYEAGMLPCRYCGLQTDRETLTQYGARCGACYTFYLTGGKPLPPMPSLTERKAAVEKMRSFGRGS